ncbi:hypothetical protein [Streptomyces sp. NPDC005476]|uniref:hypothetical protein n=1 Tax=Streptomyces sp. NPDC005476 TaxID=3156882 RepID=UPI003452DA7D
MSGLDHLVLTVVERTTAFYQRVLGMRPVTFGEGRLHLHMTRPPGRAKLLPPASGREPSN